MERATALSDFSNIWMYKDCQYGGCGFEHSIIIECGCPCGWYDDFVKQVTKVCKNGYTKYH